jgi:hypothetical protein
MCNRTDKGQRGTWSWQSNKNPGQHDEPDHWKTYTGNEQAIIEDAYQNDKDSVGVGDYIVDFDQGIQYKISDHTKTRRIRRGL